MTTTTLATTTTTTIATTTTTTAGAATTTTAPGRTSTTVKSVGLPQGERDDDHVPTANRRTGDRRRGRRTMRDVLLAHRAPRIGLAVFTRVLMDGSSRSR